MKQHDTRCGAGPTATPAAPSASRTAVCHTSSTTPHRCREPIDHVGREVAHDVLHQPEVCRPGQFQRLLGSRTGRRLRPVHRRGARRESRSGSTTMRCGCRPGASSKPSPPGSGTTTPSPSRTAYASGVAATSHHHWSTKAAGTCGGTGTPWRLLLLRAAARRATGPAGRRRRARARRHVGEPHGRVGALRDDGGERQGAVDPRRARGSAAACGTGSLTGLRPARCAGSGLRWSASGPAPSSR